MHPSEHIKGSKGRDLEGKKVVLGVTGSIAAVECVKLIRELIREGAEAHCVVSGWGQKIIHPYSLEFASGNEVITEITGQVEHVSLCGKVPDKADLYLISPATANTVSKIAQGIDDTAVTTFATTAIGSQIPMIIVPAMHQSMYDHPVVMENIEKLKDMGIKFIGPNIEEGTAKIAGKDEIVDGVIRRLKDDLKGKKITVITGSTQEPIDSMRVITNRATGRSGIEIAKRAYRRGAEIELWHGNVYSDIPSWIPNKEFHTIDELLDMGEDIQGTVVVPAAIGDFRLKQKAEEKISSSAPIELELEPTPKFIDKIREKTDHLVAYKATDSRDKAVEKAKKMIDEGRADMVVANSLADVKPEENRVYITSEEDWFLGTKREIADIILDNIPRGSE